MSQYQTPLSVKPGIIQTPEKPFKPLKAVRLYRVQNCRNVSVLVKKNLLDDFNNEQ